LGIKSSKQNYKVIEEIKNSRDLSKAGASFLLLWGSFPGTFPGKLRFPVSVFGFG